MPLLGQRNLRVLPLIRQSSSAYARTALFRSFDAVAAIVSDCVTGCSPDGVVVVVVVVADSLVMGSLFLKSGISVRLQRLRCRETVFHSFLFSGRGSAL